MIHEACDGDVLLPEEKVATWDEETEVGPASTGTLIGGA
jgi:hypothetical protein